MKRINEIRSKKVASKNTRPNHQNADRSEIHGSSGCAITCDINMWSEKEGRVDDVCQVTSQVIPIHDISL